MHYLHVSSFAIILTRKRELVALLYLSPLCLVTVICLWLFLTVPWVGLMFVVFHDQTHLLLGLKARLSAVHVAPPDVNVLIKSDLHDAIRVRCSGVCLSCRTPSCPVGN